jgi:hypothetical protein
VAIREFPLNSGFGFADYLLYVNGKACGVILAKKQGATLTGVELQSGRYARGLPTNLPARSRPLPFVWESSGIETHFTNGLDPEPRAGAVFAFFRPELIVQWLAYLPNPANGINAQETADTFLTRLQQMPQLVTDWGGGGAHYALWPAQISAITNLEKSLAANKPKALIQMATGSGNPLNRENLDEFVKLYNPTNRHGRTANWSAETDTAVGTGPDGRWRAYDYVDLIARDKASLDIFWLKDDSLADSDNLPPPDVIAQEIVDDIEAALEQFRLIAGDLVSSYI